MKILALLVLLTSLFGNLYLLNWLAFSMNLGDLAEFVLGGFWLAILLYLRNRSKKNELEKVVELRHL